MNFLFIYVIYDFAHSTKGELKGRYTRDVGECEVVVPQKVSEAGNFISYNLPHFYNEARARRGVDSGKIQYIVPIEGSKRMLELLPSEDFHGPGLLIEHHEKDARMSVGSVKFRRPSKLNCYYHGWVRDEPSSSAAISACSGLAGEITIGSNHYLIEPVEEDTPTLGPEHKHILYKREHKGVHNLSLCGTKETFAAAFEERMKWEEKYGGNSEKSMMGDSVLHFQPINNTRSKRWCTTCKPKPYLKCQSPHPPCLIERPLFLELAIVIGPRVASNKYLFPDMEQYINTIINIAAKHFQDSSLERPIMIKLVRVITLGFTYEDLDPYRYEPKELLNRFCEWQTHFNPQREVHPNHHDFILYLVKFSDCIGSMQGLTNMASVCRPDKACGVVNLEGLLTGHTITHMLGHSMGADHDDANVTGCMPEEPDGTCYHMAQHICTRSTTWSICSRQCISKFTSTHAAWCMSDIPTAHDLTDPSLLPGQVYSAAEQCMINFEMETYACLGGEFCKHLFCKIGDNECVSTGEPPAQGTRCGPDQWCFNQKCVHRGSRPGATNGEWGIWSQWTACTKTCGGGVQTSNRACDSPPPSNGGRKCPGSWIKSRMCNIRPCSDAGKGFLDQQCKNTNNQPYHGRRHEWLYFNQQIEDLQCVVMCINEKSEVAVRAPLAIDGTFCKPGAKDVCIRGQCRPVGCDWVIGSKSKEDACGICHGSGTECRLMQGYFTEQNFQGRIPFLKLPIGTSMILMRETRPSPCYFVISNSLNSTYYLNNDEEEERTFFTGVFMIQYTPGIYQLKANMERIFIKDPLRVPITVSVVCHNLERSIGILYQYAWPESNPDVKPHYTWEFLSWEKCPHSCGGAVHRATPVCVEAQGGEVEDSYCPADSRPIDRIRVCNPRPCKAKWWVGPWSECDCYMKDGIKTRMVMCAHLKAAKSYYITIVKEEECLGEDKPFSEKPCDKDAESIFWANKGERKKRDYMDLVPYSKETENYSVWDILDNSLATVNVRELLQTMDPENAEDYMYLKKIGLAPAVWDIIKEENPNSNKRVRRKKAFVTQKETKSTAPTAKAVNEISPKQETGSIKQQEKEKHNERTNLKAKLQKETRNKHSEKRKKGNVELPKKSLTTQIDIETVYQAEPLALSKSTNPTSRRSTKKNTADSWSKKDVTTSPSQEKSLKKMSNVHQKENVGTTKEPKQSKNTPEVEHQKSTDNSVDKFPDKLKKENRKFENSQVKHLSSDKKLTDSKSSAISSTEAMDSIEEVINKSMNMVSTKYIIGYTQLHRNIQFTDTNADNTHWKRINHKALHTSRKKMGTKHSTQSHTDGDFTGEWTTGRMEGDPVKKKYILMVDDRQLNEDITTDSPRTVTKRLKTSTRNVVNEATIPTAQPSTKHSVAEVKIAPGLTTHSMYETETPARSGECWKVEMKNPRKTATCSPHEGTALEPAEERLELDLVNTSNVKIFVVPIHTTLRTIMQNDNEFVLMETLAKYPLADEMKMVEHTGDTARRTLKIATARKSTSKSTIHDSK